MGRFCFSSSNNKKRVIKKPLMTKKILTPKSPLPKINKTDAIARGNSIASERCANKTNPMENARKPSRLLILLSILRLSNYVSDLLLSDNIITRSCFFGQHPIHQTLQIQYSKVSLVLNEFPFPIFILRISELFAGNRCKVIINGLKLV